MSVRSASIIQSMHRRVVATRLHVYNTSRHLSTRLHARMHTHTWSTRNLASRIITTRHTTVNPLLCLKRTLVTQSSKVSARQRNLACLQCLRRGSLVNLLLLRCTGLLTLFGELEQIRVFAHMQPQTQSLKSIAPNLPFTTR
jgi:hypothetical protein